jgi:hypothetical protein
MSSTRRADTHPPWVLCDGEISVPGWVACSLGERSLPLSFS